MGVFVEKIFYEKVKNILIYIDRAQKISYNRYSEENRLEKKGKERGNAKVWERKNSIRIKNYLADAIFGNARFHF